MMRGEQTDESSMENEADMEGDLIASTKDEGFWREMWHQVRLVWYLIRNPEVPVYLKLLPLLAVLYVLVPTDLIPDVFPVVGQLDDLTALIVGGKVFIELAPQRVVDQYLEAVRRRNVEAGAEEGQNADGISDSGDQDGIIIEGEYQEIEGDETS